ncbi:uncharacterized protein K444DRAFT_432948 [Hyaloscypha bicolor E]|uniref:Uncharacterized protein n=1 Tax=Hyaloscypha bicolor E TaxID=1095630 RepID=A0A2J6T633_9HELO|nr:uncharacterized protein K444DRAFT_432948 [Hyaloscypha bicolor E]PMD58474.1 hypothetical protein K444DRAFT_432948 [Hyaloscypha bicolor E]
MEDVTYLPHSTANACNEIIRKNYSSGDPPNISRFRQNIGFIITSINHYVQCSASRSDFSEQNTKGYERAVTGSWIGFFQSANPEDIIDTLCDIMPIGVQFILGRPNLASTDLLQPPKYEAAVELGLAGAYLDVIPCGDGTLGLYVGSGCGQGGLSRRFRDYLCDSRIELSNLHRHHEFETSGIPSSR